jgi:Zn-dependent oligopeptidase
MMGDFWHEDVQLYALWDNKELGGAFSGYVFLDLYERPGKYNGCKFLSCGSFNIISVSFTKI